MSIGDFDATFIGLPFARDWFPGAFRRTCACRYSNSLTNWYSVCNVFANPQHDCYTQPDNLGGSSRRLSRSGADRSTWRGGPLSNRSPSHGGTARWRNFAGITSHPRRGYHIGRSFDAGLCICSLRPIERLRRLRLPIRDGWSRRRRAIGAVFERHAELGQSVAHAIARYCDSLSSRPNAAQLAREYAQGLATAVRLSGEGTIARARTNQEPRAQRRLRSGSWSHRQRMVRRLRAVPAFPSV